ncbi:(1-_4)-alpha-D-glucan 1-alpha-D-glucosylmutase [Amorphus suaedae]
MNLPMSTRRVPLVATYRLQMRDGMTFDAALSIAPYLKRLGISHLYLSPVFTAVDGSTHGYDVTDFNEIDPAIGGRAGLERLGTALGAEGLGLILDIVPNHMAASLENPWWRDVVEWGVESRYAGHFDIDWSERLTLPILGKDFAGIVADGDLRLVADRETGQLVLAYFDNLLPLAPETYRLLADASDDHLIRDIAALGSSARADAPDAFHAAMADMLNSAGDRDALETELARLSNDGRLLAALHDAQPWHLIFWQDARRHLSYRRFFEVTGLVGVRVEDPAVFEDAHRLILELVADGTVDGLRVDHVDGLADPTAYLAQLREAVGPDVPIHVEKILEGHESLPQAWPIEGTTGYEFITAIGGLMTDETRLGELDEAYRHCLGEPTDLAAERRDAKLRMATHNFAGELSGLVASLVSLAATPSGGKTVSAEDLQAALTEVIVAFPVYRTYADSDGIAARDRELVESVLAQAIADAPALNPAAVAIVRSALTGDVDPALAERAARFRIRFQQLTGPVMAKAIEDTLFYRFNRLIAINEVGGDPDDIALDPAAFHAAMARRVAEQPSGLLATATHDTKRGEDARARLYAISEAPETWSAAVAWWRELNMGRVDMRTGHPVPGPATQWLLFQSLAGVWPANLGPDDPDGLAELRDRFQGYVEKALREAKRRTSWIDIDADYEAGVRAYAEALFEAENGEFLDDFLRMLVPFIRAGSLTSWAQTVIKMAAPGVPDIYQGSEDIDLSLVDPDNRRPINFDHLARQLEAALPAWPGVGFPVLGLVKQRIIQAGLALRARQPDAVTTGSYVALDAAGPAARHVVGFARAEGRVVAVVPRLAYALIEGGEDPRSAEVWGDTTVSLPATAAGYRDVLTGAEIAGGTVRIADLFADWPFALLEAR